MFGSLCLILFHILFPWHFLICFLFSFESFFCLKMPLDGIGEIVLAPWVTLDYVFTLSYWGCRLVVCLHHILLFILRFKRNGLDVCGFWGSDWSARLVSWDVCFGCFFFIRTVILVLKRTFDHAVLNKSHLLRAIPMWRCCVVLYYYVSLLFLLTL